MDTLFKLALVLTFISAVRSEINTYGNGKVAAGVEVQCNDTHMRVYFNKTELDGRTNNTGYNNRNYSIAWSNFRNVSGCFVNSINASNIDEYSREANMSRTNFNSTIWLEAAYPSECGLTEHQSNNYIYYNQTIVITYGNNPNQMIRREEYDYYNVTCYRNRTIEQQLNGDYFNTSYRTEGKININNTVEFEFSFNHTDMDGIPQTEYKLGDFIKFNLNFTSYSNTTKSVVQKCWSTSDGSSLEYNLIENRCPSDVGTFMINQRHWNTMWRTEAYRYMGLKHSRVHVECLVRVCLKNDTNPQCTYCQNARQRRDVNDASVGEMAVVRTSIFYIVEQEKAQPEPKSSSSSLSGTNGTIIIILLATLIFVVALVAIKKFFFPAVVSAQNFPMQQIGKDNKGIA